MPDFHSYRGGQPEWSLSASPQNPAEFDPDDGESFSVTNIESDPAYADGG